MLKTEDDYEVDMEGLKTALTPHWRVALFRNLKDGRVFILKENYGVDGEGAHPTADDMYSLSKDEMETIVSMYLRLLGMKIQCSDTLLMRYDPSRGENEKEWKDIDGTDWRGSEDKGA